MMRSALIGVLIGIVLGGAAVAAMTVPAMQDLVAQMQIMASDVRLLKTDMRAIRRNFYMGMAMAGDVTAEQGARSGQHTNPPSIRHLVGPGRPAPRR